MALPPTIPAAGYTRLADDSGNTLGVAGNPLAILNTGGASADTIATGNLTAAQPTPGTPVAGGTVSIALGAGQAAVEAQLTGTFTGGTTVLFEGTDDTGVTTNWFTTFGKNTGISNPPDISSVAGPGPYLVRIPAAGYQQVRVRASALNGGDSVAVRLIGSVAGSGFGSLATNDGSFSKENGGHLAAIDTSTATLHGDLTTTNSDLSTINTTLGTLGTQTTLALVKTDLDTLAGVVSSNKAAVKAAANDIVDLATLAGIVSASKAAIKAAAGDIVDLATLAGAITSAKMQANIAQIGGQSAAMAGSDGQTAANVALEAMGIYNGTTVDRLLGYQGTASFIDFIRYMVSQGKAYVMNCSATSTGASTGAIMLWGGAGGVAKNVLIYSVTGGSAGNGNIITMRTLGAIDGTVTTNQTPFNLKNGGAASVFTGSNAAIIAPTNSNPAVTGTTFKTAIAASQADFDTCPPGGYLIPANTANVGFEAVLTQGGTGIYALSIAWIEF